MAVSLRGQAQGVLGNLPLESHQDFKELVKSLEERFSPSNQTELYRTQLRLVVKPGALTIIGCRLDYIFSFHTFNMFVTIMPPFYCACYFRGSIT
jgi:hypothetical protein